MNKAYQRIVWENYPSDNTPINESNLNRMDAALDTIDSRVVGFDTTKANQSDLLQSLRSILYNDQTGVFTFTFWNGATYTADLNIEKIPVTFSMSAQGILTMTTADGTEFTADIASLIKLYTFTTSSDIRFNTVTDASGNKTITAFIVNGSVTEEKLQPNFLADCRAEVSAAETEAQNAEAWARGTKDGTDVSNTDPQYHNNAKYYSEQSSNSATSASGSATNAAGSKEDAEAYAIGKRNGADVISGDVAYQNNSKYYSELSGTYASDSLDSAEDSEAFAVGKRNGTDVTSTDEAYQNNSKYYAQQASNSATNAGNSASSADNSAEDSEAYAVGKRDGIDVTSTDEAYQNNSKYYAQQASASASSASSSASSASANATAASNYSDQSKSYAVGTNGAVRVGDATDNAKYYYEQARDISQTLAGTLRPKGTVTFSNLPSLSSADEGDMYNVSDAFITTADFKEGAGVSVAAGSNVYKTADNFWDILAGSPVTGVKGDAESNYRQGNVNITPANLGIDLDDYLRLDGENSLPEVNDVDTFKNGIGIVTGNTSHNPHPQGLSGILISFADPLNADSVQLFTDTNIVLKRITVFVSGSGYVWTGWGSSFGTYLKPNFTEASTRSNIASGETISTLFGKIKKWFSDLKTVAFSGSYNDLSNRPSIPTKTSDLTNDSGFITSVPVTSVAGKTGAVTLSKSDVGLGNVDNTADADKIVYGLKQLVVSQVTSHNDLNGFWWSNDGSLKFGKFNNNTLNNPIGNDGEVIWIPSPSGLSGTQLAFDDESNLFYQRYRNGATETWGDWVKIADANDLGDYIKNTSQIAKTVFNSYDFNAYTKSGFYRIGVIAGYTNAPDSGDYGQLIVSHNDDTILQIYIGLGSAKIAFRSFNESLTAISAWTYCDSRFTKTVTGTPDSYGNLYLKVNFGNIVEIVTPLSNNIYIERFFINNYNKWYAIIKKPDGTIPTTSISVRVTYTVN